MGIATISIPSGLIIPAFPSPTPLAIAGARCFTRKIFKPWFSEWKKALASGVGFDAETRLRGRNGTYRWFKTRALPLHNEKGEILRWFGTCTDISDIVKAREALARSRADLEVLIRKRTASLREAVADLEHFSYSITHDMRGPLRAMQSFAILLQRESGDRLPPRSLDFLHRIMTGADRLDKLIQDSLNFSKIARQKLPLHAVDLGELLRDIVKSYLNLQPPNVRLEIAFSHLVVLGNESGLTQCFANLLGNAVKFVAPGTTPCVRVWAEPAPEKATRTSLPEARSSQTDLPRVRIWIEDNGVGIPTEAQEKIFDMFHRLHREDQYPGTGIGLAIVRKAVQRMGGRVGLESQPGRGSRFWVELKEVTHG